LSRNSRDVLRGIGRVAFWGSVAVVGIGVGVALATASGGGALVAGALGSGVTEAAHTMADNIGVHAGLGAADIIGGAAWLTADRHREAEESRANAVSREQFAL
jgi:hypothetical protein